MLPRAAAAQQTPQTPAPIALDAPSCDPSLTGPLLTRLELELGQIISTIPSYDTDLVMQLECREDRVAMTLREPRSKLTRARTVELADEPSPVRVRVLTLAVLELYESLMLEASFVQPSDEEPDTIAVQVEAEPVTEPATTKGSLRLSLAPQVWLATRPLAASPAGSITLRSTSESRVGWGADISGSALSRDTSLGSASVRVVSLGATLSIDVWAGLYAQVGARAIGLWFGGEPARPEIQTESHVSWSAGPLIAAGWTLDVGEHLFLDGRAEVGAALHPRGAASDGQVVWSTEGAWLTLGAGAGVRF